MKLYRHYIWDFDGTLFDSYPHTAAAMCATLDHFGIPADPDEVLRLLRSSFADTYAHYSLDPVMQAHFRALHGNLSLPPAIVPFPDAKPVLEALAALGARHYLYTHSRRRMSVAFIEKFGMAPLFTGYMTPDDPGFVRKPDPDALRFLLEHCGIPAADTAMVGDREIDMRCGQAAGIDGILIDPSGLISQTCATTRIDRLRALLPPDPAPAYSNLL